MTLFDKMRRAFGLGSDDRDETDLYVDDTTPEPPGMTDKPDRTEMSDKPATSSIPSETTSDDATVTAVAASMLAEVVELFNSFQPEFIARCLDPERQRTLLAESLSPSLNSSIAEIIAREKQRLSHATEQERASLDARLKQLTERNVELERRRNEFKDEQLSASRQKRALKERVTDLENQVEKLEGEKEQLTLENRSMLNKLRVACVAETQAATTAPDQTASLTAELEAARAETASLSAELEAARAEKASLTAEFEAARAETASLSADLEAARAEKASLTAELEAARTEKASLTGKLTAAEADRDEYHRQVDALQGIAEQAEKFADTVEKRDARIAELKARLKEAEKDSKEIERLAAENRSLRSTIEANLYEHATEMSALRRRMEEAKPRRGRPRKPRPEPAADTPGTSETSETPDTRPSAEKPKAAPARHSRITAIDEFLESNEWLMAPSPEELASKVEEPSTDFGYQAPAHKPTIHDDDNQLTLF